VRRARKQFPSSNDGNVYTLPGGIGSGVSYDFAFRAIPLTSSNSYQMFFDLTAMQRLYRDISLFQATFNRQNVLVAPGTNYNGQGIGTIGSTVTIALNGLSNNNVVFSVDAPPRSPVEVDIRLGSGSIGNLTQDDDFVVVSDGSDNDLASELVINVPSGAATGTVTANLKMKGTDGSLKFEQNSVSITPGTPKVVKIWGATASSGENKSKVEVELVMPGGEKSTIEEDLTIIDGVEVEFEGNYYINVDTRDFGRRPWDGRKDPKPNTKFNMTGWTGLMDGYFAIVYPGRAPTPAEKDAFKKATDQSDQLGYASAVSFKLGDNSAIPAYKPWADPLKVTVSKVTAVNPTKVVLKKDKIIGAEISLKSGRLDGLPDGKEKLLDPKLELGDFVLLEKTSSTTEIAGQADKAASVTLADINTGIAAARGNGYDEMLDFHKNFTPGVLAAFSGKRYKWENDTFDVTRKTKFADSIAAKALAAKKQAGGKVAASWIFQDWNELKFQGNLSEAKVSTK
jgi:hypothetical protein